jgi:hypothetical protein
VKKRRKNAINNPRNNPRNNPIINNQKTAAALRESKQLTLFKETNRTIAEQDILIKQLVAEAISKVDTVVAGMSELVFLYVFATRYDLLKDKKGVPEWMKEGWMFLSGRGYGNPVLLNRDGSKIDQSLFTVLDEPLAITDSSIINDIVEKETQEAHNCVEGTKPLWRRLGAGTSNHYDPPVGMSHRHCVGLAHCKISEFPVGVTYECTDGGKGPRVALCKLLQ